MSEHTQAAFSLHGASVFTSLDGGGNILVIRKHNQIGDVLCSQPFFAALKHRWPQSRITLAVSPTNYPIPYPDLLPDVDEVIPFKRNTIGTQLRFITTLRSKRFQLAIVPSTVKLSSTSHILARLSGARLRAGVRSIDGTENAMRRVLHIAGDMNWKDRHQLDRHVDIATLIGCEVKQITPVIRLSDTDRRYAVTFLQQHFPEGWKHLVAVHPGAGKKENCWPKDRFAEVLRSAFQQQQFSLLITGGSLDQSAVDHLIGTLTGSSIPNAVLHNAPIPQLAAVLSHVDVYLTNDTGPMHVAAAVGTRVLSLFGPTNPREWAPRNDGSRSLSSPTSEMNDISTEIVCETLIGMLRMTNPISS